MMKTKNIYWKQRGFFSIGLGLALFAIYGALGLAVATNEPEGNKAASKQQSESVVVTAYKGE